MGNPLRNGQAYKLVVSDQWKDVQGLPLRQSFGRQFIAGPRDNDCPQPQQWKMNLPQAGTIQPLELAFGEPLDYFLLLESIRILDNNGKVLDGTIKINGQETGFSFLPARQWQPGRYRMLIAPQLEDLAGNNLERLFDRDIRVPQSAQNKPITEKEFIIPAK